MERRREDKLTGKTCFFRSERLYRMNGEWFFATREGDIGPFESEKLAHEAIDRYVIERSELDGWQKSREAGAADVRTTVDRPFELELVPINDDDDLAPFEKEAML